MTDSHIFSSEKGFAAHQFLGQSLHYSKIYVHQKSSMEKMMVIVKISGRGWGDGCYTTLNGDNKIEHNKCCT